MIKVEINIGGSKIKRTFSGLHADNSALEFINKYSWSTLRELNVPANDWTGQPAFTMWIVNEPEGFAFDGKPLVYGQGRKMGMNND